MKALIATFIVSGVAIAFGSTSRAQPAEGPAAFARQLSSYTNDDGTVPNGLDDGRDDTTALRKALAAGPGVVYVGPGFYRWGDVSVPAGVAVVGAGRGTIVRSSGPARIFVQQRVSDWAIRDMVLDGEAQGDWHERKDTGRCGIFVSGCWGYEIVGVTLRNFDGAGLQLAYTDLQNAGHSDGGNLERICASGNYVGIRFDTRAEYLNATELSCFHNVIGCVIHAGNVKIAASNFGDNIDGIVIQDKENGSHGAISNCLVNHNERYGLLCRNARNGMAIDGCCFFYGAILLQECAGINITSGLIGCTLKAVGEGANRIAGNHIVHMDTFQYEIAPATIVEGNFTDKGPWEHNN